MFELKVEGLEELNRYVRNISNSVDPDKIEPILNKGARKISAAIRAKAPKGPTENLRKSVKTKKLKRFGKAPAPSLSAIDRKRAPHAHLVEFGSHGERIGKKGSKRYRGKKFGVMPAIPFFEPAIKEKGAEVIRNVINEIKKLVEGAAKK